MTATAEPPRAAGVAGRTIAGAALFLATHLGDRVVNLLGTMILARLLTPEDFGVVALTFFVIELSHVFTNFQFSRAIVRLREVTDDDYDTAFTLSAIRGIALAAAVFASADAAAAALNAPALAGALMIAAAAPLLDGLTNPRLASFVRDIRFGPEARIQIAERLAVTATAVAIAVIWRSHLAMVVGVVAGGAVRLALSYVVAPGRPRLTLRKWRPMLSFGGWLTAAGAVHFLGRRVDVALIGWLYGTRAAGFFSVAERAAALATQDLMAPLLRVVFPALSSLAGDRARMIAAYNMAVASILGMVLPFGVGLALIADEAVRLLAGSQWASAAPIVQVLAPAMALAMANAGANALVMVDGDTRAIFLRNSLVLAVKAPLLGLGVLLLGLPGIIAARAAGLLVDVVATLHLTARATGQGLAAPVIAAWRSFAACAALVAAVVAVAPLAPDAASVAGAFVSASMKAAAGGSAYVGTHLALWSLAGAPDGFERRAVDAAARAIGVMRRAGARVRR
jgi:PST family polysaccharide transporter